MQVKTTQKISRSAVATVLATSSVALGVPAQTNAAQFFKDIKPADFFYTAVNELAEKKVVNGYGDGTFRPFNNVTRGEAAKMLALSLKLDVANAETTQFSDVKKGDIFYKYIAALANKGIINGYPDGSFKPNEVVQRGAMAKMVALGYEFALAKNITHPFKDVDEKYIFNQHIQTLVNLNITKGTSFNTFDPGKAVTRGELATFISRANKADAGKPNYVVDNIIGNKIYINSVGYTIGSNVAAYIKAENKSALIGAHVEGTFNGMTLTNVTKLTLNATGNANSIYNFDGGNSTYNGTLVVNGSYIKFKNWTLNGQTIVSETPRKSLAQYNRISEIKIASLASGIIDFTRPTNPDDGNLNDGGNGGSLKPGTGTSPNAPYREKLSPIHKYVDFTNVTVRNLFVEQNHTYVAAQKEIAMVTIRRDVEFAEFNFNMRNLYIEGDESLTLYGTHDITTVYKNSYYSVYFNSNSEINTLIVDNSSGWIDLGDYVVVGNVIIPPKTTPNDIFDDYKNDNDKIGKIEDNTGKDVDRNPIENGVVPDVTKPIVHSLTVEADSNQATASLTVNETGKYHYLILPENAPAPTVREIVSAKSGFSGNGTVIESEMTPDGRYTTTFVVRGLESVTKYTMYVVHVDDAGNFSARQERNFETKDGTPPKILEPKAIPLPGGRRINLTFNPSETGTYYYFLREQMRPDTTITVDDIISIAKDAGYTGAITQQHVANGFSDIIRDAEGQIIKPETNYVVYVALIDESGNKSVVDINARLPVKTTVLDETPPYVTGPTVDEEMRLIPAQNGSLNQFYMYFSEKLDKASAENVNNYQLTGTGIINVPGQSAIKPSKVVYEERANRVLITIPSLTGFVNGDTLRVTVLPAVKDLAENSFENINNITTVTTPRNYAEYRHVDNERPNLLNLNILRNADNTLAEVHYNATKAGTVYYMILPTGTDLTALNIDAKDFVDEFNARTATNKFNSQTTGKLYLEGAGNLKPPITAELGQQKFDYNLKSINPDIFLSYDLYIVLKDRSGNLSPIEKASIIYDKKEPDIRGYQVKATKVDVDHPDNTGARMQFDSNESGTVFYRLEKKYVVDTERSTSSNTVYKLNPKIYRADGTMINIHNTVIANKTTNVEKEQAFRDYFAGSVQARDLPMSAGLNTINFTGLNPHEEYVAIIGVKDTPGNFTILDSSGNQLITDFYTDHTNPKVISNLVYQNLDGTFTITFSESIMRNYVNTSPGAINLTQKSTINTSTPISDIISMTGQNVNDFEIVSYTEGARIDANSKLVIRKKVGVTSNTTSFEVTINDKMVDQLINSRGNQFEKTDNMHKGKFIKRQFTAGFVEILHEDPATRKTINAVFDFASTPEFATTESIKYYYQAVSGLLSQSIPLPTMEEVINTATQVNVSNSLATGTGTDDVNKGRNSITLTHTVLFTKDDILMLVLEDKYGNRILINEKIGYVFSTQ